MRTKGNVDNGVPRKTMLLQNKTRSCEIRAIFRVELACAVRHLSRFRLQKHIHEPGSVVAFRVDESTRLCTLHIWHQHLDAGGSLPAMHQLNALTHRRHIFTPMEFVVSAGRVRMRAACTWKYQNHFIDFPINTPDSFDHKAATGTQRIVSLPILIVHLNGSTRETLQRMEALNQPYGYQDLRGFVLPESDKHGPTLQIHPASGCRHPENQAMPSCTSRSLEACSAGSLSASQRLWRHIPNGTAEAPLIDPAANSAKVRQP